LLEGMSVGVEEGFRIMEGALRGFEAVNKRFNKNFTVKSSKIGVNANNEVKVWFN
jgi:hypothetical protein